VPSKDKLADPDLVYAAMEVIPNDDVSRDEWNTTGMAIFAATDGHDRGFEAFAMWSEKSAKCNGGYEKRWHHYFRCPPTEIGAGSIFHWANQAKPEWRSEYEAKRMANAVSLDDFRAYMPMHSYIFTPNGEMWPAASVNARIRPIPSLDANGQPELDKNGNKKFMAANTWLDKNRPVEQMTWAPGLGMPNPRPTNIGRRMVRTQGRNGVQFISPADDCAW
jgi:Primase C terminal 2 (PriCT-2)